jgi:hypothetical protein
MGAVCVCSMWYVGERGHWFHDWLRCGGCSGDQNLERCWKRDGGEVRQARARHLQGKDALSRCGNAKLDVEARACMLCLNDVRK